MATNSPERDHYATWPEAPAPVVFVHWLTSRFTFIHCVPQADDLSPAGRR